MNSMPSTRRVMQLPSHQLQRLSGNNSGPSPVWGNSFIHFASLRVKLMVNKEELLKVTVVAEMVNLEKIRTKIMGIPINRPTTELEPVTLEAAVAGITEMEVVIKRRATRVTTMMGRRKR